MFKNILISILFLLPTTSYAYECNEQIDNLSKEYNIPIHCKIGSFRFVNEDIKGRQASQYLLDGVYKGLNKFFAVYGKTFLKKNIDEIILLEDLKYSENDVGGLSDGEKIYIGLDDYSEYNGYRDYVYFKNLNHEFSSNILKNAPFYKRAIWKKMAYIYDSSRNYLFKCLSNSDFAKQSSEYLLENGILSNYGLTGDENDFNVYAERLFTKDITLLNAKKHYEKVRKKLEMLKEFYRSAGFVGNFPDET
jgi:hypothetical protein